MKSERLDEAKDAVNKLHALEMELAQTKAAREKEADCLAALEQSKTKVRKDLIPRPCFPLFPLFCARSNVPPPTRSWCFVPHDAASHFSGLASSAISSLFVHYSKLVLAPFLFSSSQPIKVCCTSVNSIPVSGIFSC